tara:strand:+ start:41 stop:190 length:150 start_codon:yes stop_codon:yes gene_type:complete
MEKEFDFEIAKRFARAIYGGGFGGGPLPKEQQQKNDAFLKMYLDFLDGK